MFIRLLFDPNAPPGLGSGDQSSTVTGPPPEATSGDLGSFSPYEEPTSSQPGMVAGQPPAPMGNQAAPAQAARPAPVAADPNNRANQAAQAQADQWQSVREAATQRFGYQVPQGVDSDEAFLAHLVQAAQANRQADVYAQVGRQIAPQLTQFQEFQRQQQAQTANPAAPDYAPPPFDERWLALVERDPATGVFYSKPGAPTGVAEAVNKYQQWQTDFQRNPIATMDRYAEAKITPMVQQLVQQQLASHQQQNAVQTILSANDPWLYQRDATGNYLTGPQGRVLTAEGTAYGQQIRTLSQAGINDPTLQDQLARQLVAGQMAIGRLQQTTNPAAQVQQQQALARSNVNPNQARGSLERATVPGTVEPDNTGLSLAEMLRSAFDQNGYSEQRFQSEFYN